MTEHQEPRSKFALAFDSLMPLLILAGAFWLGRAFILDPKKPEKVDAKVQGTFVTTEIVKAQDWDLEVVAYGRVVPHAKLSVMAEVKGRLIKVHPELRPGGIIDKGEVLFAIDPRDYATHLEEMEAMVTSAEVALKKELGQQEVALKEWEFSRRELPTSQVESELSRELALRKPQLREREAALKAAQAQRDRAKTNLERCVVVSPFRALVMSEKVVEQDLIMAGREVAMLYGVERFDVELKLSPEKLQQLDVAKRPDVRVQTVSQTGKKESYKGRLDRNLMEVGDMGGLARVLVAIDNPLGKGDDHKGTELLLNSFVRVSLQGPRLNQVFVIPRERIQGSDRVWIRTEESRLDIRKVEILARTSDSFIVGNGLNEGDALISSSIPVAIQGMLLVDQVLSQDMETDAAAKPKVEIEGAK